MKGPRLPHSLFLEEFMSSLMRFCQINFCACVHYVPECVWVRLFKPHNRDPAVHLLQLAIFVTGSEFLPYHYVQIECSYSPPPPISQIEKMKPRVPDLRTCFRVARKVKPPWAVGCCCGMENLSLCNSEWLPSMKTKAKNVRNPCSFMGPWRKFLPQLALCPQE